MIRNSLQSLSTKKEDAINIQQHVRMKLTETKNGSQLMPTQHYTTSLYFTHCLH